MGDKQKNKDTLDGKNEHPILKKCVKGGGIGVIFAAVAIVAGYNIGFIKKADISEVIELFRNITPFIKGLPGIVIIALVLIVCIFACIHDKVLFRKKFLRETKEMIKNDPTIRNITMQEDRKKKSISIDVQRDNKKGLNDKTNNNTVKFRRDNLEVK